MMNGMSMHHRKVESLRTVLRLHTLNKDHDVGMDDLFAEADRVYDWIAEGVTERRDPEGEGGERDMTDELPRVVISEEQAVQMMVSSAPVETIRLPERPTMPCRDGHTLCHRAAPIPNGTRVEVGGWEDLGTGEPRVWHPVATATVDHVERHAWGDVLQHSGWRVTLTDIEPLEGER